MSNPFPTGHAEGLVIASRAVMYDNWPILLVTHWEPGNWHFVNGHGDTDDVADSMTVHVEHVLALDPSIGLLRDLPAGWQGWRGTPADAWTRQPIPADEGDP